MPVLLIAWLFFQSSVSTIINATTENVTSNHVRHGDAESAKRENAAPRFSTCVSRKNPGIIWIPSCNAMSRATTHLVSRSSATTNTAMMKCFPCTPDFPFPVTIVFLTSKQCHSEERASFLLAWGGPPSAVQSSAARQPIKPPRKIYLPSISLSTALHRSHTVGYSASSPTRVE